MKTYIYANGRIIAQRNGGQSANKYFYVNDRLGSVRQVIDMYGSVERNYTYSPFGQLLESGAAQGAPSNPFMFTGQWFDDEISQYFLRARMYDPALMRFTSRDPVSGKFKEPLTLHVYLYCLNDPINRADLTGNMGITLIEVSGSSLAARLIQSAVLNATLSAFKGGSVQEIFWSGVTGAAGGFAAFGSTAWLSTAGYLAQMPVFRDIVGTALGAGVASVIKNWDERTTKRFYTDLGTSMFLAGVWGGFAEDPFSSTLQHVGYDVTLLIGAYGLDRLWDEFYEALEE